MKANNSRGKRAAPVAPVRESAPSWQVLENVVAAIERAHAHLPGMSVTQKVQMPRLSDPTDTRDVDVLVEIPVGGRTLRVGVEVKAKGRPLTIDQMGCIVDLRWDIAVDRFCVVSMSGFSAGAAKKALENNIELSTIEEFERSEFWAYAPQRMIVHSSGHLLETNIEFSPETPEAELVKFKDISKGAAPDDVLLVDETGQATLTLFVSAMFQEYFKTNPEAEVHGAVTQLRIDTRERQGLHMMIHGVQLPGPTAVISTARIIREVHQIPERRFRLGELEVTTSEMNILGEHRQVSLVREPRPDGSTQLKLSIGPANPSKVYRRDRS
jgi:hypothetical protein